MAKRIKIKGNPPRIKNRPPRGLSKAERVMSNDEDENFRLSGNPGIFGGQLDKRELIEVLKLGSGATRPSSTRKKLVKEGNSRFIGPRTRESIIRESFDEGSRQLPKVRMAEDESEPIGQNDEIYRRLGEMLLRKLGSRRV